MDDGKDDGDADDGPTDAYVTGIHKLIIIKTSSSNINFSVLRGSLGGRSRLK